MHLSGQPDRVDRSECRLHFCQQIHGDPHQFAGILQMLPGMCGSEPGSVRPCDLTQDPATGVVIDRNGGYGRSADVQTDRSPFHGRLPEASC